jgi:hypothetical protein
VEHIVLHSIYNKKNEKLGQENAKKTKKKKTSKIEAHKKKFCPQN